MTKLEEMARAAYDVVRHRTLHDGAAQVHWPMWEKLHDSVRESHTAGMRAALENFKTPDGAMLRAGTHDTNAFERMIDAVLTEKNR